MGGTAYITTASWEPRFIEGAQKAFDSYQFSTNICLWFTEFASRTKSARVRFSEIYNKQPNGMVELPMFTAEKFDRARAIPAYATAWKIIRSTLDERYKLFDSFIMDITTMPRETLWVVLDLLTDMEIPGTIIYHRALRHGEWCAAEPERPHIVPKLGGLQALDAPSKLLMVTGYDGDRSEQFIASYEPRETLLLYQEFPEGMNAENREKNEGRHRSRFGSRGKSVSLKGINCYGEDWGYREILGAAKELSKNSNLILASLGPKTSAVSLYRVHRAISQSCLVYAPCKRYNEGYSEGIGETMEFDWNSKDLFASQE